MESLLEDYPSNMPSSNWDYFIYSKTHKHKYMNLVLAETVNDKNGSRRRITTVPDSFDMTVTFDQEGTCLLNFLSLDGSLIMSTAIETDKDMKEIILHTDKKSLKRIARNLLASINYDILYLSLIHI